MDLVDGFAPASIEKAVTLLKRGDIVAFPTETVYGLGADAFNPYAVAKIFEMKKRPTFDPLIVHIGEKDWVSRIAVHVPSPVAALMDRFWPGPLTIILTKKEVIPDIVTAGLPTVGIRMPSHPVALNLIRALGNPIAAPSANPFGYMSPTKAAHVARMFKDKAGLLLDGGKSVFGIESTILSVEEGKFRIRRHGAITLEELEAVAGTILDKQHGDTCEAPGELPYHYAPHKPLRLITSPSEIETAESSFLAFMPPGTPPLSRYMKVLTATGDLREAAANFFSFLIDLDREDIKTIYAEKLPEVGVGKAMMERLKKASKKYGYITR
jgi:L-threonylcarbamoyladenylate synthase